MNKQSFCQASSNNLWIVQQVIKLYPDRSPFLHSKTTFQFLIAVILSAQCTDAKVNQITPPLFKAFQDPWSLANAPLEVLEKMVHSTGFYRAKARNIQETAKILIKNFEGQVPLDIEDLLTLPGVGRKTANVIRGQIGKFPAIIVDTHFKRVTRRLGLTTQNDPEKIERDLDQWISKEWQYDFSMAANRLGRDLCQARKPRCLDCSLRKLCPASTNKTPCDLKDDKNSTTP